MVLISVKHFTLLFYIYGCNGWCILSTFHNLESSWRWSFEHPWSGVGSLIHYLKHKALCIVNDTMPCLGCMTAYVEKGREAAVCICCPVSFMPVQCGQSPQLLPL